MQEIEAGVWQGTTETPEQTRLLGAQMGRRLSGGGVIALTGPLGSGKTCLVQGLGEGLQVREPVTSPTFVLIHHHRGRIPLYHVDAYRLHGPEGALEIGILELFERGGVVAIEWADHILGALPDERLDIQMAHAPTGRTITLRPRSALWQAIVEELTARAGPWD